MNFLSIDHFEDDYAICQDDDEGLHEIDRALLPPSAKPGDILKLSSDGAWIVDLVETARRKENILNLQNKLFNRN